MSYTPPTHDDLSLNFTSNYTPPAHDDLSLNFGTAFVGQAFVAILTDTDTLSATPDYSVLKIKSLLVDTEQLTSELAIFAQYGSAELADQTAFDAHLSYQKIPFSVALSSDNALYPKLKDFAQYVGLEFAAPTNYSDAHLTIRAIPTSVRLADNSDSLHSALDYNALPTKTHLSDGAILTTRMQPLYTPLSAYLSDVNALESVLKRYAFGSSYNDYAVLNTALSLARGKIKASFNDVTKFTAPKLRFYAWGSQYSDVNTLSSVLTKTAFNLNAVLLEQETLFAQIGFYALGFEFAEKLASDSLKPFLKFDYPPFFVSAPPEIATYPYPYRYFSVSKDREGAATVSPLSIPDWLTFDPISQSLTGIPPPPEDADPLYYIILQTVDNIGQFVTQEWGISVMSVYENPPPSPLIFSWLRQPRKGKIVALHVRGYSFSEMAEKDFYFASEPFTSKPTDSPANRAFLELILDVPVFESSVGVDFSGAEASWGMVSLFNNALNHLVTDHHFDLRSLSLKIGDRDWAYNDFYTLFAGVVAVSGISTEGSTTINVGLRNNASLLNKPLLNTRYPEFLADGVTPHPSANELIPEVWGGTATNPVFNVKPTLIDPATHKYQVHNGKVENIVEVRDVGLAVSFTPDLENGTFTLNQGGAQEVRCDVQGGVVDWDGQWVQPTTPAEIVLALARRAGIADSQMFLDSFDALNGSDPVPMGLVVRDQTKILDLIKPLLNSCNSIHEFDPDGKLVLRKLIAPPVAYEDDFGNYTPLYTITDDDLDQEGLQPIEILPPFTELTLKYRKNWDTLTQVAGVVAEDNPELQQLFARGFSEVVSNNANPDIDNYLSAQAADAEETLLTRQVDAQYYADIRMDLRSKPRMIAECKMISDLGAALRCADHIGFATVDNEYGCNDKRWVVIRVAQNPLDGFTEIKVLEMSDGT